MDIIFLLGIKMEYCIFGIWKNLNLSIKFKPILVNIFWLLFNMSLKNYFINNNYNKYNQR